MPTGQVATTTEVEASLDEVPWFEKTMATGRKEDWRTLSGVPLPQMHDGSEKHRPLPEPGQPPYLSLIHI